MLFLNPQSAKKIPSPDHGISIYHCLSACIINLPRCQVSARATGYPQKGTELVDGPGHAMPPVPQAIGMMDL